MSAEIPKPRTEEATRAAAIAHLRAINKYFILQPVSQGIQEEADEAWQDLPAPHDSLVYAVGDRLGQLLHKFLHPLEKRK